ncbi:MAG TPA: hypothetical protein VHB54_17805 [Mucilaginibacter sp.]|nr:hypothetical protein [Mucilaginibacter sp.]
MEVEITQTLKPLRLLFLTKPYNKQSFVKTVRVCSAYFGGKYFPIIPFYQKFSSKFSIEQGVYGRKIAGYYNQLIENYSVDFVIYDDSLDLEKIKPFISGKQLVALSILEKSLCTNEPSYGFALHQIIPWLRTQEYKYVRSDNRQILFSTTEDTALIWKVLFGDVSKDYRQVLKQEEGLSDEDFVRIDDSNGMEYLHTGYQNMLDIGSYGISADGYDRDIVFWLDETDLLSINNFWNLRALGCNVICVPYRQLANGMLQERLSKILAKYRENRFWHLIIQGAGKDDDELTKSFRNTLFLLNEKSHKGVMYYWWALRYWEDEIYKRADHIGAANLWISTKTTAVETRGYISLPVLKPGFMKGYYHLHVDPVYTNTLSVQVKSNTMHFVEAFPKVKDKDVGLLLRTVSKASISSAGLNFYPNLHDTFVGFTLPQADTLLAQVFAEKKMKIKQSSAGKLTREVLKNLGGIYGVNIFNSRSMVDLLLKFRGGQTLKKKALFDYLERHKLKFHNRYTSKERVEQLIKNKFIRLGASIECTYCNRSSFYLMDQLDYEMKCKVCENVFTVPSGDPDSIVWSYQGVGPFALNNAAEGSISVLLTLRFFKSSVMTFRYNTTILGTTVLEGKEEKMEIDLTLFQQHDWSASRYPDLIFGECKTDNEFLKEDVLRMSELGKIFPGSILLFSTLKKQLNREEKRLIKKLANALRVGNQFRPVNPILILTGNELLPENPLDGMKKLEQHKVQAYHNDDSLGHLCEMSNAEYLGLKPYRQIIEKRYQKKWKRREAILKK